MVKVNMKEENLLTFDILSVKDWGYFDTKQHKPQGIQPSSYLSCSEFDHYITGHLFLARATEGTSLYV